MQRSSSGSSTNAHISNTNRLSPIQKKDFRNESSPLVPQRSIFRNNNNSHNIDKEISDSNITTTNNNSNNNNNEILQSLVQNESVNKSNKKLKTYCNVLQNNKLPKVINTDSDNNDDDALGLGLKDNDTNEESNEESNEDNEEHENSGDNITVTNPTLGIMPIKPNSNSDKAIPPLRPPPTALTTSSRDTSTEKTTATTTADGIDSANGGNTTGNTTFTSGRGKGLELSLNTTFNNSMNSIQPIPSALNAIVSEEEAVSQMIKDDTNHLSAISSSFSALQNGFMNNGLLSNGKNQSSDTDESDYNPNHSYNYSLNNTIEEIQNQMNVYTVQSELLKKTEGSTSNGSSSSNSSNKVNANANANNNNNNKNINNNSFPTLSKKSSRVKLNNENELRYSPLESQPNNYYPTINSKRLISINQKKRNKSISKEGNGSTPNSKNSTPQIGAQRVFSYEQYELFNELKSRN
ncbi:unnamed protein product [[Candida] boidinii]|nr:unnamed protein product [[Candida] boidinii]